MPVKRWLPQVPELAHAGKIHRLPDQPATGAAISEIGDTDAVGTCQLRAKRRANRNA